MGSFLDTTGSSRARGWGQKWSGGGIKKSTDECHGNMGKKLEHVPEVYDLRKWDLSFRGPPSLILSWLFPSRVQLCAAAPVFLVSCSIPHVQHHFNRLSPDATLVFRFFHKGERRFLVTAFVHQLAQEAQDLIAELAGAFFFPVETVDTFDINRYTGRWYQVLNNRTAPDSVG